MPKINYARKVAFNASMIVAVFKALFHPRKYEYNILLHQIQFQTGSHNG